MDIIVPEGDSFRADAMNDQGDIAGGYVPAGGYERPPFGATAISPTCRCCPARLVGGHAASITLARWSEACGILQTNGSARSQACVWENGTVRALVSVAGATESAAWAINDAGTIVGHVYTPLPVNGPLREAVVWQGSAVAKLAPPIAGAQTWARAIDSSGRVAVSWSTGNFTWRAARWTPNVPNGTSGTMTTLGIWGSSFDINDAGVVSGSENSNAYLWDGTTPTGLNVPFWGHKEALGINNAGVAVGYNEDTDTFIDTAWVAYSPADVQDLNVLLTYSTMLAYPGSLGTATSINNAGQILVSTSYGQYTLLTPSSLPPEPKNPVPPRDLAAYGLDGYVDLYWSPVYFAESYNVKRSTVSGGPYTTIASNIPWNSFRDDSVAYDTTYYYVVSSVNGSYESANSAEAVVRLTDFVPAAPSSVSASALNSTVNVTWSFADYAKSYNVKRSTVDGGPYTTIATGITGLAFTDTSVLNGTRYYYVVSSQDGTYESGNSTQVSAIPLAAPLAPTSLTAKAAKGGKSVNLTWQQSASPDIRFNRVYRSVNGGAFTQIAQINAGTAYVNSNLARNTTYGYKVTAINVNGQEGNFSNTVSIQPK
jgi:fibronectin type 3 domain-containing protein